jgi:hypothetical protein
MPECYCTLPEMMFTCIEEMEFSKEHYREQIIEVKLVIMGLLKMFIWHHIKSEA